MGFRKGADGKYHVICPDCGAERDLGWWPKTERCRPCGFKAHGNALKTGTEHVSGSMIGRWKVGARARKIPWTITPDDLEALWVKQDGRCALTGIVMDPPLINSPHGISLDRIDSTKGYEPGNIQFLCAAINLMKWSRPEAVFIELCKAVAEHSGGSTGGTN